MKGFKAHNMYKTEKANTYKEHLALEKKGYDHNPYKKLTDPPGRSKKEEIKHDISELKKEINKHSDKPNIVKKLKKALNENQEQLERLK